MRGGLRAAQTRPAALEPGVAADDFKRENAFYDHALDAAREALRLLKHHKIPVDRPHDYYAEMLKTDDHMQRIKQRILSETSKIEAAERARKQRDNKKFGKKVQQEVLLKRQRDKTSAIGDAAKLRKGCVPRRTPLGRRRTHAPRHRLKQQVDNARDAFDVSVGARPAAAMCASPRADAAGAPAGGVGRHGGRGQAEAAGRQAAERAGCQVRLWREEEQQPRQAE